MWLSLIVLWMQAVTILFLCRMRYEHAKAEERAEARLRDVRWWLANLERDLETFIKQQRCTRHD